MKVIAILLLATAASGAILFSRAQTAPTVGVRAAPPLALARPAASRPVLVELYQSQGCSSCPPANANLNAIADRRDVVALSFGVTYWDQLGWTDSFAKPQFTQRQWDYARANARGNVSTPQVWINGRSPIVGNNAAELAAKIARANPHGPALTIRGRQALIGAAPAPVGGADIWLAQFDPATRAVPIRAGENGGRTLAHRNIVTELRRVGHWSGQAQKILLPDPRPSLRSAVFLQVGKGGRVIASARDDR